MSKLVVAVLIIVTLIGCGGGTGVVTLVIDPPSADVQQGHTARFTVDVQGTTNKAVTWASTGGRLVAKGGGATFIALEAGTFEVTATSQANPTVVATATILVTPQPGMARIRFVTDGSLVLAGEGVTKRVAVEVLDADGTVIDSGTVTWSSSDPAVASVAQDGDRAALVTTETSSTSQALVMATFEDLEATASVLITLPRTGTVLIDSEVVLAKSETTVTLARDATTEGLSPGQRLVSGSRAGVLAQVASVAVGLDTVVVTTIPTSIADAFDEFSFEGGVEPLDVTVHLLAGRSALVTTSSPDGRIRTTTVLDDVTCTAEDSAKIDVSGSDIIMSATIYGELALSILLGSDHFLARFGTAVDVAANTGTVSFSGSAGGTAVCSLELPRIGLAPLSAGVITLWTGFVPVLGVEVGASGGATTFSLGGPYGGLGAALEGGIEYTDATGWSPLFHSDVSADFEPFSATASLDVPFTARLAPFGRVDIGISLDLGVDALAVPIIDARFVELKGYGYLDFAIPAPVNVASPSYEGPDWALGAGTRGALKAEFQGLLPDLLEYIGIDVNFAGQLELFEEEVELLTSPSLTFLAIPAVVEIPEGSSGPVALTAFTDDDSNGTVSFWASKDGSTPLTFLTSAPLESGTAETTWTVAEEGEYTLYARVSTDAASTVKPYAASNTANVTVTEEDDEEEDTGPLGNEGPFRGTYTHFSLGQCHGTGVALTIDFVEQPNGQLTGTYVGHYCADLCIDIEPYPTGPVSGTLSGNRSGSDVTFALSAPVGGLFTGERWVPEAPAGSASLAVVDGIAEGVLPCQDEYGTISSGFFSFVGTESIWF